jgi:uncharacterized protein YcfJ
MKTLFIRCAALIGFATLAMVVVEPAQAQVQGQVQYPSQSQEVAHVLQISPRMVTIAQQQCQQVLVQGQDNSTAGTIIGGVAGGILGNQVGRGEGRTAATALGAVVGAFSGSALGGRDAGVAQYRTVCNTVPVTVQQGEIVTFEFRGRQFTQIFAN